MAVAVAAVLAADPAAVDHPGPNLLEVQEEANLLVRDPALDVSTEVDRLGQGVAQGSHGCTFT